MTWTAEDRRRYAPAVLEVVRAGMIARLARTIDLIDPPPSTGRPRLWSTPAMLQALWFLCRFGAPWRGLSAPCPPRQSVATRLARWRAGGVLDRTLAATVACLRLARGRRRRPADGRDH